MKLEINRLNTFDGKWPLTYVKPNDLAKNGFFYLQNEDAVQCAFCKVILDDWNVGQKPFKEHVKNSPKCPLLTSTNVENVPIPPMPPPLSKVHIVDNGSINFLNYKPKHATMTAFEKRYNTFRYWPVIGTSIQELASCGFYYTGVDDHVTCFFCGGTLGNWQYNKEPWVEHVKFFPHCAHMKLVAKMAPPKLVEKMAKSNEMEFVKEASLIFDKTIVEKVALQHFEKTGRSYTSLPDLCTLILEYIKETIKETSIKESLLCKICMDKEMSIVLYPCKHLVACPECAEMMSNCPICRTPITSNFRVYTA